MKTMKKYFYRTLIATLLIMTAAHGIAQGNELEKTYQWKYDVNETVKFTFNNYDCDLIIHTWDKAEIEYKLMLNATLRTEEEARKLDDFLNDLKFSHSAGRVEFDNRFWTSKKAMMGKKTISLKGAGKLRFSEFKMTGEMWIPENCLLELRSKYSEINMEDMNEMLTLNLYNDKLYAGTLLSPLKIEARYSTLEFVKMNDMEAELYNTTIECGDMGDLQAVSKYSNIRAGNAGKIDIDAYNDKYSFENTGDIKFIDKYSDLSAGISGHTKLDCYNSTVELLAAQDVDLNSKYGRYFIDEARNLNITSSYNDKYRLDSLLSLNISQSKYSDYEVEHLESSLYLKEGYEDKFDVLKTGDFRETKVNGKYIKLKMGLDDDISYRFKAEVKYPKFDINEEAMTVRIKIKEGSDLQMEAIKGEESEGMPAFFVNGYEMSIALTENQ